MPYIIQLLKFTDTFTYKLYINAVAASDGAHLMSSINPLSYELSIKTAMESN